LSKNHKELIDKLDQVLARLGEKSARNQRQEDGTTDKPEEENANQNSAETTTDALDEVFY